MHFKRVSDSNTIIRKNLFGNSIFWKDMLSSCSIPPHFINSFLVSFYFYFFYFFPFFRENSVINSPDINPSTVVEFSLPFNLCNCPS